MVHADLHTLLAALVSLQGPLSKPWDFSYPPPTPSRRSPGWGWLWLAHSSPPALSKMVKKQWRLSQNAKHVLTCSFFIFLLSSLVTNFAGFFESCRFLWRVGWTNLVDAQWSCVSFLTLSRQSFSTSAATSAMEVYALRCLWCHCRFPLLCLL